MKSTRIQSVLILVSFAPQIKAGSCETTRSLYFRREGGREGWEGWMGGCGVRGVIAEVL